MYVYMYYVCCMVWTSFQYISMSRYFKMILFLFLFGFVFRNCEGRDANNCEQCERCEHNYQQRSHSCHDSARNHVEIRRIHSAALYSIRRGWDVCMYVCMYVWILWLILCMCVNIMYCIMYVCINLCIVCVYVCKYVCMFEWIIIYFSFYFSNFFLFLSLSGEHRNGFSAEAAADRGPRGSSARWLGPACMYYVGCDTSQPSHWWTICNTTLLNALFP